MKRKVETLNELVDKTEQKLFLTPAELRRYPKYKDASDEEVWNAINTFHTLALVCYDAFVKEETTREEALLAGKDADAQRRCK